MTKTGSGEGITRGGGRDIYPQVNGFIRVFIQLKGRGGYENERRYR